MSQYQYSKNPKGEENSRQPSNIQLTPTKKKAYLEHSSSLSSNSTQKESFASCNSSNKLMVTTIEDNADHAVEKEKMQTTSKPECLSSLTHQLAIDCEMVTVGTGKEGSCRMVLARVSLVNAHRKCVFDKYVKRKERIIDFHTEISGIRAEDLDTKGEDFMAVRQEVASILSGRLLVGHAVKNDLQVLMIHHPPNMIRDIQRYRPFLMSNSGRLPSLKHLAVNQLGLNIQTGEHCSIQDATATMKLYLKCQSNWEKDISNNDGIDVQTVEQQQIEQKNIGFQAMRIFKKWLHSNASFQDVTVFAPRDLPSPAGSPTPRSTTTKLVTSMSSTPRSPSSPPPRSPSSSPPPKSSPQTFCVGSKNAMNQPTNPSVNRALINPNSSPIHSSPSFFRPNSKIYLLPNMQQTFQDQPTSTKQIARKRLETVFIERLGHLPKNDEHKISQVQTSFEHITHPRQFVGYSPQYAFADRFYSNPYSSMHTNSTNILRILPYH